jgi:hypothetical protein
MGEAKRRKLAGTQSYVRAPPPYLDIDAPANVVLDDFYAALSTGNAASVQSIIREVTHLVRGTPIDMKRVPVFDLGHLTDTTNPTADTISEAEWNRLDRAAIQLQERGELHLPYPECIFLFRFSETKQKPPVINLVCLTEVDGPIRSLIYMRRPDLPTPMDFWVATPLDFVLSGAYIHCVQHPLTEKIGPEIHADRHMDAASRASDSRVVMMLLNERGPRIQLDTPPAARGTASPTGDNRPPPPVQVIKVLRLQLDRPPGEPREPRVTGIIQRPHWKRGFWATRTASGKTYWVPARAVHGGGEPRIFKVETDTA